MDSKVKGVLQGRHQVNQEGHGGHNSRVHASRSTCRVAVAMQSLECKCQLDDPFPLLHIFPGPLTCTYPLQFLLVIPATFYSHFPCHCESRIHHVTKLPHRQSS